MRKTFLLVLLTLLPSIAVQAADMRCQGDLMSPGTIAVKVRKKCGEPIWEERVGEIKVSSRDGKDERLLYITEMTYEADGGYYVLTFEGGELAHTEFYKN